jgi:hypothetical protein
MSASEEQALWQSVVTRRSQQCEERLYRKTWGRREADLGCGLTGCARNAARVERSHTWDAGMVSVCDTGVARVVR